jgi:hypothetical protein
MDIMYQKPVVTEDNGSDLKDISSCSSDNEDEADANEDEADASEDETDASGDEADANEEQQMAEGFYLEEFPADAVLPDLSNNYLETIKKFRSIVKYFRNERKSYLWNFHYLWYFFLVTCNFKISR